MNQKRTNLLIATADGSIRLALRAILARYEFEIVIAAHSEEALALVGAAEFDVVLLDINLSGMDAIEICRLIRESRPHIPVIMLTAKESEDRNVKALDAGADDFITQPFRMQELIARIRLRARQYRIQRDYQGDTVITIDRIRLDPARHRVEKNGKSIHLTPKQFELLRYLMMHAGVPLRHSQLLRTVWGTEYGNELHYLRTYIRQLRIKLEDDPANPDYLLTEPHIGYSFKESTPDSKCA